MVLTLALRFIFHHTTLELVLNSAVNLNFQLLIFYIKSNSSQKHGDAQQK